MADQIGTIYPPELPSTVPDYAQWLLGQGAGTWFSITSTAVQHQYNIKRYKPNGDLDCDRIFNVENNGSIFDTNQPYQFIPVSHCAKCRIVQNEITFVFNYIGE